MKSGKVGIDRIMKGQKFEKRMPILNTVAFLLVVPTLLIFHFLQDFERKANVMVQVFKYNNLHFWGDDKIAI